ncbi:hypothetical protein I4U23_000078 [Adineta vaga]|nr:hypothetical protein I4U23_000078 [Adineta vaga]
MQRWTNDQFVSTIHRVINLGHNERYSIGLFFGPNYFTNIDCLPTCFDNVKNPKKYKPILAGDFIMSRIVDGHTPKFDEFDLENVPAEQ